MLISYSIRDKTALNVLIYLQAPPDSLSFCLTDALQYFCCKEKGRQLFGGVVMLRCGGGGVGSWRNEGRGGEDNNKRAKQNKEGTENNLKLCIDPAVVIVHIFHSPKGPIPMSLKCKGKEMGNKKKTMVLGKGKPLTRLGVMSLI